MKKYLKYLNTTVNPLYSAQLFTAQVYTAFARTISFVTLNKRQQLTLYDFLLSYLYLHAGKALCARIINTRSLHHENSPPLLRELTTKWGDRTLEKSVTNFYNVSANAEIFKSH